MSEYLVRSIVRTNCPTVSRDLPIRNAIAMMVEQAAEVLPVLRDDGSLEGILTQKDCFRPALHASYYQEWKGQVADYMSAKVITVDADDDLVRAAEMFLSHPHRILPVLEKGRLLGVLNRSEVLALLSRIG
ncbi:CBS domain-containing protein [Defluviimonas sp. WL0002]|uniref:CBS domain-containing protein n=1 Tax=Albidovulum marisflavi TaxID=2984159 RepID=A0ABT2ZCC6_9RHOB|nr:CBS domain-containing protein [Defluviimonas sp. WL0002]MCV2868672.1 CBS domain-containing protein [Defluviimonas sp. WL0002]